ncbi:MAG: phosphoribosylformylglycinamidine synthase [Bacteroidetes bacterium]|nr:phosphoribosylformylglycinamidine synthase [Bacteroidota bacterium]
MIIYFQGAENKFFVVECEDWLSEEEVKRLSWLFSDAKILLEQKLTGLFVGPRKEMITPWSTNAVEITQNMGISNIKRIEEFLQVESVEAEFDPMLEVIYQNPGQKVFAISKKPEKVDMIFDIGLYNEAEGLALSEDEVDYLKGVAKQIKRLLTDSEVYGFAQVNSEHCRHKIFNGKFIIDGEEMEESLFEMIKKTSKENPNRIISAYKDNVAFVDGPEMLQFAPESQDKADFFCLKKKETVISLKAETHNFPTTVEPFNGAATGTGGEIRDRMAGGKASMPIAGTAVYITSYPRLEENRSWEQATDARKWLYQSPEEILIKASNGASDFGNKFGQPLICGSLLTFEHFEKLSEEELRKYGFDKVIMQAGGIGYGKKEDAIKDSPKTGDRIVVMGGDNYRIGMGGGAVSSVATGEFSNKVELNAVQRSNPEMQKRVCNAIRAMAELDMNPIISIHDHGAGGHLNSISELVEESGGTVQMNKLPIGDPTLSAKEIIGNESQERMGLIIDKDNLELLNKVSERERAPIYDVGECTGDQHFKFEAAEGRNPMDIALPYLFGKPPKSVLEDKSFEQKYPELVYEESKLIQYIDDVLQLEAVACKDWLTNKVDRSVTGKVAKQQCTGPIQLPLNNVAVTAIDYSGNKGIATSIGHAPIAGLVNPEAASRLAIAEALTNMVWAPIEQGLKGVSLSANWMWPAKNEGENYRLYKAVKAVSDFSIALGINVPTGKDSLSMVQKYPDGEKVYSPGTVIISTVGEVSNINQVVTPELKDVKESKLLYIDFSNAPKELGGSSFAQVLNGLGQKTPDVVDADYFKKAFESVQHLIQENKVLAGHDISAGGLVTTLLEMCFPISNLGLEVNFSGIEAQDKIKLLFAENPGIIIQVEGDDALSELAEKGIRAIQIAEVKQDRVFNISNICSLDIDKMRDKWYYTSYLFDSKQAKPELALDRYNNYKNQELSFQFPQGFTGKCNQYGIDKSRTQKSGVKAAIIREKGVNGDREMAYIMHLAGLDVKDVHMTDLISGRDDLSDVNMIVFVGGFSNSDVLGSAKGWAGAFLYNEKAKAALDNFYAREDTLSLGVCNGCQVMTELELVYPKHDKYPKMKRNASGKFESGFINVDVLENDSVMLKSLAGSRLGIWIAHGEGKFELPKAENDYLIPMKFSYDAYPANPNGSPHATAAIVSEDGRHLAMMPHLERAFYPYHWANYPADRRQDEITPWVEAFVNAKKWIEGK